MFAFDKKPQNTYNFSSYDTLQYLINKEGYDIPMQ